jgi:4a-hydroxytetrahydrobiopterin dehydratase
VTPTTPGPRNTPTVLDDAVVDEAVAPLEWTREANAIVRSWKGPDFAAALVFVNAVGAAAEKAGHHPDIEIHWNQVVLRLWTHSACGITEADLDLARRIDAIG